MYKLFHRSAPAALVAIVGLAHGVAWADGLQNTTVRGSQAQLAAGNLGGMTGNGVKIGVIEAGNNIPNYAGLLTPGSSLPNGNPFLPAARFTALAQGGVFGGADTPGNHASTVAGVIASTAFGNEGIATNAHLVVAGISGTNDTIKNTEAAHLGGARIMNYSFGTSLGAGGNTGNSTQSLWMDYAARTFAGARIQDILFVVAGNETPDGVNDYGSPSDGYNCINVGATGRRNGVGGLVYDQQSQYNRTNITGDISPLTGWGRMKTDIVAPGGDTGPSSAVGTAGTVGVGGFGPVGQFYGTSGGQIIYTGSTTSAPENAPIYSGDDWSGGGLMDDAFTIVDNAAPLIPGPPYGNNPGPANFAGGDRMLFRTTAGTSFAAPLVAGAAALLHEKGAAANLSTDHRVVKAVLLNGADKNITDKNGAVWARAAVGAVSKPNPSHGAGNIPVRIGLDPLLGTGQMDVVTTGLNYTAGQHGPGNVPNMGWDLNSLSATSIKSYLFTDINKIVATLTWDRIISANNLGADNLFDPATTTFTNSGLTDLDLFLYRIVPGGPDVIVDWSTSDIDNVEHIFNLTLPLGNYRLEVANQGNRGDEYGLAWRAVPTPGMMSMLACAGVITLGRRRRD